MVTFINLIIFRNFFSDYYGNNSVVTVFIKYFYNFGFSVLSKF